MKNIILNPHRVLLGFLLGILSYNLCYQASASYVVAVGALGSSSASSIPSNGTTLGAHSSQYGGGLLLDFRMFSNFYSELGLLYLPRGFNSTPSGGQSSEITFTTFQFPLLLRIFLGSGFSIGAGAYFSHGFGYINMDTPTSSDYGLVYGADDYGMVLSSSLSINIISGLALVVDGRYLMGFQDISKVGSLKTYLNDFQFLAGIQFGK